MGFDTTGQPDHISNATAMGIMAVRHVIFAALADVITGATIKATTAGRIPLKMALTCGFSFIRSGVRNMAMHNIIRNDGIIVPRAAATLPRVPRRRSPTATEMFTAEYPEATAL